MVTVNGSACYEVFQDGHCNEECKGELCLLDGFDCKADKHHHCWYAGYVPSFSGETSHLWHRGLSVGRGNLDFESAVTAQNDEFKAVFIARIHAC